MYRITVFSYFNVYLHHKFIKKCIELKKVFYRIKNSLHIINLFFFFLLQMVTRTKKIFVGGLSAPTTLEDVKNYFEQFGPVSTLITIYLFRHKLPE